MLLWTLLAVLGHPEDYSRNYTNYTNHHVEEPSSHHRENHRNTTRGASVRAIECLRGCPDKALDFHDPEMVCLWWHAEGEHNPNSCFGNCSDRVLHFMEKKIHHACMEFEEMHMHGPIGPIYLRNGNTTDSDNATHYQNNEQHYQEDYRNTTRNDTESHHRNDTKSHHEHKKHHHDHDDHHHEEHDHEDEEHDDMPECLEDCRFEEVDFSTPESACPWFHAEAPEHNTESCFIDCSPGVMYHINHHVDQLCNETEMTEEEQNPFECVMDCPIEGLDPHSADSFCPWFSETKNDPCFYDCSDDFLNMAQAHAEHTCAEYEDEAAANQTTYINEPLVDELVAAEEHMSCGAGFYQIAGYECKVCPAAMYSYDGDYECSACPEGMTSFPGAMSPEECFKRH